MKMISRVVSHGSSVLLQVGFQLLKMLSFIFSKFCEDNNGDPDWFVRYCMYNTVTSTKQIRDLGCRDDTRINGIKVWDKSIAVTVGAIFWPQLQCSRIQICTPDSFH